METLILVALIGLMDIACFWLGAKVGQTVSRGEIIETPTLNPVKAIQEHIAEREAKLEADIERNRLETIMRNIEAFDGTSRGQTDVPGR